MRSGGAAAKAQPRFAPLALIASLLALAVVSPAALAAEPATSPEPDERVEAVIAAARSYLGRPYRVGSEGPNLFDCSGLVYRAFADTGQLSLIGGARVRAAGYQRWFAGLGRLSAVEEDAQRGDLVMYNNGAHIGIYLGERRVLSALTSGVSVHSLRGINQAVTGFLKVDWSGGGAGPIADPGTIEAVTEEPAELVPAAAWIPALELDAVSIERRGDERIDMRTATSRTFEQQDGSFTTEFFSRPIFHRPPESTDWEPIDLRFVAADDDEGGVGVTSSPLALSVRGIGDDGGFLSLSAGEQSLSLGVDSDDRPNGSGAEPVISPDGRYADYFDALSSGSGLRVIARADGFHSFIVLPREPRERTFSFRLDAPGLTPTLEADGSLALRDAEDTLVGRIPRPFLLDSSDVDGSGGGVYTSAATLDVSLEDELPVVSVTIARRFLDEAVYPAYINLALVDFPAPASGADLTFASSRHPNSNFDAYLRPESPGYADLWHGRQPGTRHQSQVYIRFTDLAAALGDVDLAAAHVELFPYWQRAAKPSASAIHAVIEPWSASSLTWNDRPAVSNQLTVIETNDGRWASADVSAYLAQAVAGEADNGIAVGFETGRDTWKRFAAGGGVDPLGLGPRLVVNWSGMRPLATPVPEGASASPLLAWSHGAAAPDQTRFEVQVSDDDFGSTVVESGVVKGRAGGATAWQIPGGSLIEGERYSWRVRVKYADETAWSPWSNVQKLSFGVPATIHGALP